MPELNKYIPGTSHLVDYAILHYGAEICTDEVQTALMVPHKGAQVEGGGEVMTPCPSIDLPEVPETRPPFPYIMGASRASSEAKIQEKCTYQILAVGDDTLELNFGIDAYQYADEFQRLGEVQKEVQAGGYKLRGGKEVDWFGEKFNLLGRGLSGGYKYFLQNGDIILWLMPEARGGKPSPELRVKFLSSFLWREGEINAYNKFIDYVNKWAVGNYVKVSRVDPCVDLGISLPDIDIIKQMVSKVRKKANWERGEHAYSLTPTGKTFGSKGIAYVRIYDKLRQMKEKKLEHMIPVWKNRGYVDDSPVTRLEYELHRDGLTYFDKDMTFDTYLKSRGAIWRYMTDDYLRIIESGSATRRKNCKIVDYWQDFKACVPLFGEDTGALPYKVKSPEAIPLIKQANGCYATAYAKLCADFGEVEAIEIIEKLSGMKLSDDIILAGNAQRARFAHLSKKGRY